MGPRRRNPPEEDGTVNDDDADVSGASPKREEAPRKRIRHRVPERDFSKKPARVYPHEPRPRVALIDTYLDDPEIDLIKGVEFQGLINLMFMILISSASMLVIYNYLEKGWMVDFTALFCMIDDFGVGILLYALAMFFVSFCYEWLYAHRCIAWQVVFTAFALNEIALLALPIRLIFLYRIPPFVSLAVMMWVLIIALKIHSFVFTTHWMKLKWYKLRYHPHSPDSPGKVVDDLFPGCGACVDDDRSVLTLLVTFRSFLYFVLAPVLTYEASYPRTSRIRWWYVAKEFTQAGGAVGIFYIGLVQFILPEYALLAHETRVPYIMLGFLKQTVPSIILWLLGFYAIFHCLLNGWAELIMFADRQFYLDWWNAPNLDTFWRKWNVATHEWMLRHIYFETVATVANKRVATTLTFLLSGLLHEVLFSVGFRRVQPWFFLAMLVQIPMIHVGRWIRNDRWGNVGMWLSLYIGQPLVEFAYLHSWFTDNPQGIDCMQKQKVMTSLFAWGQLLGVYNSTVVEN